MTILMEECTMSSKARSQLMKSYMPLLLQIYNWWILCFCLCCTKLLINASSFIVIFIDLSQKRFYTQICSCLKVYNLRENIFFIYNFIFVVGFSLYWICNSKKRIFLQSYFKDEWVNQLLFLCNELIPISFNVISLFNFIRINFNHRLLKDTALKWGICCQEGSTTGSFTKG